jgi:DNA repair ATPase RecN
MNREFNISIKDFQIIKKASLTFLPGLNCIIGQSNNGKSAIIRAAKSAIYNIPGTTSVRSGCNNYAVGIQANGHTVIFQKGANSAYKIDGVAMTKIGRTQLPEVADALGIRDLNLNGNNEEINFLDQMEKPFLLDRSETELFRFIVDSGKDSNVTVALKSLTQDRQQLTRDITTTEGRLEQVDTQLKREEENLVGSEAKLSLFQSVIDLGPRITRSKELTALREAIMSQREDYLKLGSWLKTYTGVLDKISPSIEGIVNATKKQELLNLIASDIKKTEEARASLLPLLDKYVTVDTDKLASDVDQYNKISQVKEEHFSIDKELESLKKQQFPEFNLDFEAKIKRCGVLRELIGNINTCQSELESTKAMLEVTLGELEVSQKEINELGVCPMCGKPLHVD